MATPVRKRPQFKATPINAPDTNAYGFLRHHHIAVVTFQEFPCAAPATECGAGLSAVRLLLSPCARHQLAASCSAHSSAQRQVASAFPRLCASMNRSSGAFERHRNTIASRSLGVSALWPLRGAGDSNKCAASVRTDDPRTNGGWPVSRKYASAPTL